ncbi:MAG: cytochrome c [Aquifex sp.]|nr:MAG: cytochrome c [Aquifex sp.]
MKKFFLGLTFVLPIFAIPSEELMKKGYEVFKKSCSACHVEYMSHEEIRQVRMRVMKGEKPPIQAPPMNEVALRVKHFYPEEEDFIEFVKNYITEPMREKGVCMPMAFKLFGVMPPIGKGLSEEEKEAVAYWMYHRYEGSWEEMIRKFHGHGRGIHGRGKGMMEKPALQGED